MKGNLYVTRIPNLRPNWGGYELILGTGSKSLVNNDFTDDLTSLLSGYELILGTGSKSLVNNDFTVDLASLLSGYELTLGTGYELTLGTGSKSLVNIDLTDDLSSSLSGYELILGTGSKSLLPSRPIRPPIAFGIGCSFITDLQYSPAGSFLDSILSHKNSCNNRDIIC
ncbi:hypothetical protein F8388_023221 [Cannabis sativa]|uniref:Uncharacterized protein n=1 Tax=Cannabis sativa TaxID=3483 RepID=A0A7J6HDI6_CANSA|nr:hypothetical protein F8388_023221 [Cannabis sativa]KAF4396620.1 hypothetical protein G4B88_028934 [Cannabis sativa]